MVTLKTLAQIYQSNKGGLGALAAQRQQGGQADPRMMEMFKRLQGGIPGAGQMPQGPQMGFGQGMQMGQPGGFGQMDPRAMAAMQAMQQQQMGQRVDQFGRPSATGQFAFDPGQQQRIAQAGPVVLRRRHRGGDDADGTFHPPPPLRAGGRRQGGHAAGEHEGTGRPGGGLEGG